MRIRPESGGAGALNFELADVTTPTSNDLISVTGDLTIDAGAGTDTYDVVVTAIDSGLAAGSYTLIQAAGGSSAAVDSTDFTIEIKSVDGTTIPQTANLRQTFTIDSTTAGQLNLNVAGSSESNTWTSSVDNNWDIKTTANWTNTTDTLYADFDDTTFPNIGMGASSQTVNIVSAVNPGSVTFTNTEDDYTVTGAGIKGATGISKTGAGTVIINNSGNAFSGGVDVDAGTLQVVHGFGGLTAGAITIAPGATMQLGDGATGGNSLPDAAGVTIVNNGELIADEGTGGEAAEVAISGTGLVRVKSSNLNLNNPNNTYSGDTILDGGNMTLGNGGVPGDGTGTIVINATSELKAFGETHTVSNPITLNGGGIQVGGGGPSAFTLSGDVSVTGASASVIRSDGGTGADGLTMGGNVSGAGDLEVRPDANATITFNGSLGGHTGVLTKTSNGRMALNGNPTIGSSTIDVDEGNLDVSGSTSGTLALSGQTLSGDATVTGDVTTAASTTIRVGDLGIPLAGTRTVAGHWTFDSETTGVTPDSSANANDATLNGNAAIVTPAAIDVSPTGTDVLAVDQSLNNNEARTNSNAAISGDSARSYAFWMKAEAAQEPNATMIGGGLDANGQRFDMRLQNANFRVEVGSGHVQVNVADATQNPNALALTDDAWHHVVVVMDQGDNVNSLSLYVDGIQQLDNGTVVNGATIASQSGQALNTGAGPLAFGNSSTLTNDRNFDGLLDDVQLYDAALTAFDAKQLFDNPGDTATASLYLPQDLQITGDLTMDTTSTLEIDIASTQGFDSLVVDGVFTAAGTLDVNVDSAYMAQVGDTFGILDFGSVLGSFDTLSLESPGIGFAWDTSALLSTGVLSVVAGQPGDFDGDGDVDGADFLKWQREDQTPAGLTAWRDNYGFTTPLAASGAAAVPEPSSVVLLSLAGLALAVRRRRLG
ncbi:MAG: autotransporter-associated beta strand repeat-containing protein, partial [Pirellulales bacterium]|nr:autotransporter-associated beta strand repeat-containing protein [Pirellulales bacterium]